MSTPNLLAKHLQDRIADAQHDIESIEIHIVKQDESVERRSGLSQVGLQLKAVQRSDGGRSHEAQSGHSSNRLLPNKVASREKGGCSLTISAGYF
jgi:hypothetical protein